MTHSPSPRLTREARQEQTRQRLIAAACQQVAERGYDAASVRDIANAAGYTQGAFYSNFKSKEALLIDLLRQHKEQKLEQVRQAVMGAGEDFTAALAALEHWAKGFAMDAQQAMLATELHLHAARNPAFGEQYTALMADQRQSYAELLEHLFALAGKAPPAPPQEMAGCLMALTRSLVVDRALDGTTAAGDLLSAVIHSLFR
ncbi:TetR/AcrR family transcriptional regulator [Brenneria izadpanahii]|uniref:TetR/AcrR family transcriptional regulator n=1 Tax=Brenneria izadpanahii TaxID=2722756 RepID=A0ABX7UQI3_9GAMM|nr:TetR/AcrR family transcriptional regulator [Brenneria izadpanahii]QTF07854.1 TetR/AcrR family transcriptional regulator [Brenneria izadpanahii]